MARIGRPGKYDAPNHIELKNQMNFSFDCNLNINSIRDKNIPADILIAIPSKGHPYDLLNSMNQLISSSYDRNNYDLHFIIDDTEMDLYNFVVESIKPDFVSYIKPLKEDWSNIKLASDEVFKLSKHYFYMPFSDDICGLSDGWDSKILSKKKYFKDDIFCLYNHSTFFSRRREYHENCYYRHNKCYIESHGESLPIWTRKLFNFVNPIFDEIDSRGYKELIYLTIIYLLFKYHKKNRNVLCDFKFSWAFNDATCLPLHEKSWKPMMKNDFKILHNTVKEINIYIENFNQQE